jgi:hypothetical protein
LGVVAAEHFLVVVVGDVGDAAAEGERLLDLRGLAQSTDVGWAVDRDARCGQPVTEA